MKTEGSELRISSVAVLGSIYIYIDIYIYIHTVCILKYPYMGSETVLQIFCQGLEVVRLRMLCLGLVLGLFNGQRA